jgi:ABC-2 type transport system permease protein
MAGRPVVTVPQPGIGLFARLKLRLIAGALRGSTGSMVGFVVGVILAASLAPTGFVALSLLRGHGRLSTDIGVMAFTVVAVAWAMFPLLVFGTDETLDPTRLALLPITRWALARGMFVAALVGIGPLTTTVVLTGAVVGLSGGPLSVVIGVVAVVLQVALCVAGSRALAASFSGMLRSRRGRDLAVVFGLVMIVLIQGGNLVVQRAVTAGLHGSLESLRHVASVARWLPPGMAADAISMARDGRYGVALGELAIVAAVVALLLWLWIGALGRSLESYDASTQRASVNRRGRAPRRLLPVAGRVGAVAGKELRYAWRDPRRKVGWLAMIGVGIVVTLSFTNAGVVSTHSPMLAMYFAAGVAGLQTANQYGIDGPATWMNAVTIASARDMRADLTGRNLAHAAVALPCLAVLAAATTLMTGAGPVDAVRAYTVAIGVYGITLGLCDITSVVFPYSVPQRAHNPFAAPGSGRGCLAGLTSVLTIIATILLASPLFVAALVADTPWLVIGGPLYGVGMAALGGTIAANLGFARLPELLSDISRGM